MDSSAYINYEDDPEVGWTHTSFTKHWYAMYSVAYGHRPRWTIKEISLLTKLMKEYDHEHLAKMMEIAINNSPEISFAAFYSAATDWYRIYLERYEGWSWS